MDLDWKWEGDEVGWPVGVDELCLENLVWVNELVVRKVVLGDCWMTDETDKIGGKLSLGFACGLPFRLRCSLAARKSSWRHGWASWSRYHDGETRWDRFKIAPSLYTINQGNDIFFRLS